MNQIARVVLILILSTLANGKTSVQPQSLELKSISLTHSKILICSEFECETLGSTEGYSKSELQQMFLMNSQVIKKLNYERWFVGIAATALGSYLYKWGQVVASVGVGFFSFPKIKSWEEKIRTQKALEQRPQLLSDGSFELSPEDFSVVKEALINAVALLEACLRQNEQYYGYRGFEYCKTGHIPDLAQESPFYGYP
jgi:hypothetical protein